MVLMACKKERCIWYSCGCMAEPEDMFIECREAFEREEDEQLRKEKEDREDGQDISGRS
jgi:hypothetical protein